MVIAPTDFRDEEYFVTKKILEESGIEVHTCSKTGEKAKGSLGGEAICDYSIDDIKTEEEYDALIFIGGSGASVYFEDDAALGLAKKFNDGGKVVGAICIAPVILANAGILRGKRATVWGDEYPRLLKSEGAVYTGADAEADGNIVTASEPRSAERFGRLLAEAIKGVVE